MLTNDVIIDAFKRIKEEVHDATEGLSLEQLAFRPDKSANSIGWLVWHLTRIQDDHIAGTTNKPQVWNEDWRKQFKVPFATTATGWGQTAAEVAQVQVETKLLLSYYDAVHTATVAYVKSLTEADYEVVVDKRWNPPVTLAVRLVSVISDDLQHVGQAAYIRGLLK